MLPANNLLDGWIQETNSDELELRYNGRLDWDQITRRGFIYTANDVILLVNQYTDSLYVNGAGYLFPNATEIAAGSFIRGGMTFFIVSQANEDAAQSVSYSCTISNLQPNTTYYVWSFIDYVFQTSGSYPVISDNRISFVAQDGGESITKSGQPAGVVEVQPAVSQPQVTGYYNVLGEQLPKEPANGVYFIKYDNDTVVKVVRLN